MNPLKVLVTSKKQLAFKYGNNFSRLETLFDSLIKADAKKGLDTKLIYIDDKSSAKAAGIELVTIINDKTSKKAVDEIAAKHEPAYIMIVGAADIIPFQCITNPADDDDTEVESDLPYACDAPYSKTIDAYTGPTRVVGRLPDIEGPQKSIAYLKTLITNIIKQKPAPIGKYSKYFAMSTQMWKKSTAMSLQNMFNDNKMLLVSPSGFKPESPVTKEILSPLVHFYNCHGALRKPEYYGQKGNDYPVAMQSPTLVKNLSYGTVIAAECCYGAQIYDPKKINNKNTVNSLASTYLQYGAISFLGSSTIAYGPTDHNSLADLLTQYFIKSILDGASAGRALLEARQKFLSESGPQLDPYELKTLAQFLLLGDPSVQPVISDEDSMSKTMMGGTVQNNRMKLVSKGISLRNSISPSVKTSGDQQSANEAELQSIIKKTDFGNGVKTAVYALKANPHLNGLQKKITDEKVVFRTFIKEKKKQDYQRFRVLVVKENKDQVLGWRVYESR